MNAPVDLAPHLWQRIGKRLRPLAIELDQALRAKCVWGDAAHYGLAALTPGQNVAELLPVLQGLEGPIDIDFPFVEIRAGLCANLHISLKEATGGVLILTDDTDEKLRYQSVRQASNETILGAYRRKQAEDALFREKELAEVTLKSIGDAVMRTNRNEQVTYLNPIAETMTGWSNAEAFGKPVAEIFRVLDGATLQPTLNPIHLAISEDRVVGLAMNTVLVHRSGRRIEIEDSAAPIHDRDGAVIGAVLVFHDVSEARAMAARMTHLAQHDTLTGLPNRVMLQDRVSQAMLLARRHNKRAALLFIDLDRFKNVNDSLGHIVGDKLLQELARRLKACVRGSDTVSRQGGDEFVVLLAETNQPSDAAHVAEKMLRAVGAPCLIEGHELNITLSIGISIFPDDATDVDALMRNADAAMYHAKENGRDNFQFFTHDMHAKALARQGVESGLRRALQREEFVLHYQPKICLRSSEIVGFEALVRWLHPAQGLLPPARFIPIAEECGLIGPIGEWVMREACAYNRRLQQNGVAAVPMAVNVSAAQFRDKELLPKIAATLRSTGLEPQLLELELTETILMRDGPQTLQVLEGLRRMGIKLSIDDFGTGYSSLAYLKHFSVDALKIDQSFVRDVHAHADNEAIIRAIIAMAKGLKQRVIAEGVETEEQLRFLRAEACDEMQGFYLCPPLAGEDLPRFLSDRHWKLSF